MLKLANFKCVLVDDSVNYQEQFGNLLNSMFVVSKFFYKDHLRTVLYFDNNTFTQGYNKNMVY